MGFTTVLLREIASFPSDAIVLSNYTSIDYLDTGSVNEGHISQYARLELDKDKIPSRAKRMAREGDIIYSSVRPSNRHYAFLDVVPENAVYSTGFIIIRVDSSKANPYYVYLYLTLNSTVDYLQSLAEQKTSTYPAISQYDLQDLPISLPDRQEQDAIAAILHNIDRCVFLNQTINDYLIHMQSEIIKNYNSTHRCEERSIYDLISIKYGSPFKSSMFSEEKGVNLVRIRDLKTDRPQIKTTESIVDMEYVCPGDVVVGMDAEFRPHIWVGERGLLNQRVCKLIPNHGYSVALAYHYLKDPLFTVESYKTGTTVSHIGKSDFDSMTVKMPSDYDLHHLSDMITPLHSLYVENGESTQVLTILRDCLLANLFDSNK